jgi:hypothetical protein
MQSSCWKQPVDELQSVALRGGVPVSSISKKHHYLMIREIGSRDWMRSTHGRKIEKAMEYNGEGHSIAILSEQHWFEQLSQGAQA